MSKKVISHNQSGGITGFNVNVDDSGIPSGHKRKKKSSWYWNKITKAIYIIAAIIAILSYFGIKPEEKKMSKEEDKKINVTSYNQSGGITAYNVNIGPQDRRLGDKLTNQLDEIISQNSGKKIVVTAVMGDQEAFKFASQIKNYLVSKGYEPEGVNQSVYTQPVFGQIIDVKKNHIDIIIGSKQ
jgi:hypothetical protein